MAWRTVFGDSDNKKKEASEPLFEKEMKTNLPKNYPREITQFVDAVRSDLIGSEKQKVFPNLSHEEKKAMDYLMEIQKSGMIVIQPADKNLGLVIMNREDYITEANRQLNDSVMIKGTKVNHYSKTNDSILTKQIKQITDMLMKVKCRLYF